MACAVVFLEDNGYTFTAKEGEVEAFALEIIFMKHDIANMVAWLKDRTRHDSSKK